MVLGGWTPLTLTLCLGKHRGKYQGAFIRIWYSYRRRGHSKGLLWRRLSIYRWSEHVRDACRIVTQQKAELNAAFDPALSLNF
ncbi:hypothetical protein L218DRAFT_441577 [Marasmius fiardii PR-910]|nr:hypothetical protein L218DRAFT_441577 [Marasmius fiardii PR-910]